jgi:hypothetical protein
MAEEEERLPTNMARIRQAEDRKQLWMVLFTLVILGGALIALIYGWEALLTALPCLLGGGVMILAPWWLLVAIQKWRDGIDRADRDALDALDE